MSERTVIICETVQNQAWLELGLEHQSLLNCNLIANFAKLLRIPKTTTCEALNAKLKAQFYWLILFIQAGKLATP